MATQHHLRKKRGALKSAQISFLRALLQFLTMATPLGMLRAKFRVRLKWPTICLCLEMFVWYFCLCYHVCLLRTFPNCHSVCYQNNKNVCTLLNNMVVVTMDHRSSLDSGTQCWTHQLIAQSHYIISCWLWGINHVIQTNAMFITL